MAILENFENAWDPEFQLGIDPSKPPKTESSPMVEIDNMGREKFWEEEPSLAVKLFSETCCTNCSCKS
jgi:hypothetical protein